MLFRLIFIFVFIGSLYACTYDSIQPNDKTTLLDNNEIDDTVTYTLFIKPIIDDNCKACHSPYPINEPPYLVTYDEVRNATEFGVLKQRVVDEYPSVMPPNKSLSNIEKQLLLKWIAQGYPE